MLEEKSLEILVEDMLEQFAELTKNSKPMLCGNKAAGRRFRKGLYKLRDSITPLSQASLK